MPSSVVLILLVLLIPAVVLAAAWWLKNQFPPLARKALQDARDDFLREAHTRLQLERQEGLRDLESKRQAVDSVVTGLAGQLERYERLMKEFESDRERKFGRLETELGQVAKGAEQLQRTTAGLAAVLGNSRVRGQWGQKMAEDILRLCGLQESIHYRKELENAAGRPDYTFLLPEAHSLFMDVKFPLDHYLRFTEAQQEDDQQRCKDAFIKSVREHLREMERRAYGATDQSVDYTILFIPNEQVYAAVNEWMPQLIDECLQKKLILCGPWTLYAIVRIIHQAWQNYRYSTAVRDIVETINGFMQDYAKFKDRFGELGELLDKLDGKYREIAATSAQRLDGKIRRIEEYRKGQQLTEGPVEQPNQMTLEQLTRSGSA
ncbi:MAG: DNA recombination protein RmuC [Candidatus Omnitrophica bacterium]|nr:DNA recombination protein RmuC [Candidatus Omnitrophota bacterium]